MRTNIGLSYDDDLPVGRGDLIAYFHPREIVSDNSVSIQRRREMLAFWLSDANALPSAPSLRSSGRTTTTVAEIREALVALDELEAMIGTRQVTSSQQTAA